MTRQFLKLYLWEHSFLGSVCVCVCVYTAALHNLSDSCQLCSIYSASQNLKPTETWASENEIHHNCFTGDLNKLNSVGATKYFFLQFI